MTVRMKLALLLAALASLNLAIWDAKQMLEGALDPILKALGA